MIKFGKPDPMRVFIVHLPSAACIIAIFPCFALYRFHRNTDTVATTEPSISLPRGKPLLATMLISLSMLFSPKRFSSPSSLGDKQARTKLRKRWSSSMTTSVPLMRQMTRTLHAIGTPTTWISLPSTYSYSGSTIV